MFFNGDFYPSNPAALDHLVGGLDLHGKIVLDPSVGSGNLVKAIKEAGAKEVLGCENDKDLIKIAHTHCTIIEEDFLNLKSEQISHIDYIIANPPFSKAAEHINHMFKIAPLGCKIISLCNYETLKNPYSKTREELKSLVEMYGQAQELGDLFTTAERKTDVNVGIVRLDKPGSNYSQEFEGFFMDEDPYEEQSNGIMSYNAVRDLVNRYVECVKIYDQQLETAVRLNDMKNGYFDTSDPDPDRNRFSDKLGNISVTISQGGVLLARNEFKKRMQKSGWRWIFDKMNLTKSTTKTLREDINKFVEQQEQIPFTMKNIYRMLEIVIATTGQRMDKAILEAFDKVTKHHHDNHYRMEGWKTNSHYLLTKRFIVPGYYKEEMEDVVKAMCYITGENYDDHITLYDRTNYGYAIMKDRKHLNVGDYGRPVFHSHDIEKYERHKSIIENNPGSELVSLKWEYGKWFDWGFFNVRKYKKGTIHFEFKSEDVWAQFNQRVAKLKGYPLPEKKEQTKYQERQNGRKETQPAYKPTAQKPTILATFNV